MEMREIHPSINLDRLLEAATDENEEFGFCILCGTQVAGIEPDIRHSPCPDCGEHTVYGVDELIFMAYA